MLTDLSQAGHLALEIEINPCEAAAAVPDLTRLQILQVWQRRIKMYWHRKKPAAETGITTSPGTGNLSKERGMVGANIGAIRLITRPTNRLKNLTCLLKT
jgi:hypothetical protein